MEYEVPRSKCAASPSGENAHALLAPRRSTNLLRLRLRLCACLATKQPPDLYITRAPVLWHPSLLILGLANRLIYLLVSLHLLIGDINWLSGILNELCGRQL